MGKHPSTGLPICRPVRPAAVPVISRRWYHNTLTGDARLVSVSAILERMIDKRPQADRLLIAELTGEAGHRAKQSKINNSGLPSACRLLPGWYGRFVGFWPDGVVPVRVEAVAVDRQGFHLLLGVDEASGVFTGIQLGSDGQPGGCGGG